MAYTKYSLTPANNTAAPPDGAPEGMLPSAVNDTMRDMMAQIRDVGDGVRDGTYTMTAVKITGGTINGATIGATSATTGKFTTLTNSALTSGRVTYAGTAGVLQDSAALTFDGSNIVVNSTTPAYFTGTSNLAQISINRSPSTGTIFNASQSAAFINIDGVSGGSSIQFATATANNTQPSEAMRINSSGNLLLGTTSNFAFATSRLAVNYSTADFVTAMQNSNANPFGTYIKYSGAAPNGASNEFIYCHDGTLRFSVMSNGGISNYSANNNNLSDEREKKNIELAPNYLNKICQIPVKTFLYNDQTDTDLNLGVIAQDVETVCPELIMESNWGTKKEPKIRKSIYQTDLQYALMKCIQEQQALIESLTTRLSALENK